MGNDHIRRIGRFYGIAGVAVILFIAINMIVENFVYVGSRRIYDNNTASVQTMTEIKDKLSDVNERVMLMIAGLADDDVLVQINADFGDIDVLKEEFIASNTMSVPEERRFRQALLAIQTYRRKIDTVGETLITANFDTAHSIYRQELSPLSLAASEMLDATIEVGKLKNESDVHKGTLIHGFAQMFLILGTIAGVVILYFAGKAQIAEAVKMQLKQGFDLNKHLGQSCRQYCYDITNYGDADGRVIASLYIQDGILIAGDIHSTAVNGFMHGLTRETAE